MNTIFLSAHCTQYVSCVLYDIGIGPISVKIFIMGCNIKYPYQHTCIKRFYLMFLVIKWMRGCHFINTLIYKIYFPECASNKLNWPKCQYRLKQSRWFLVPLSARVYVGHIRAPLIKQHFISAAELHSQQRGQEFLRLLHNKYPLCLILRSSQDVNS